MNDVRCPECSRLLAKERTDGAIVIRYRDRYSIVVVVGDVTCIKCQTTVNIGQHVQPSASTWGPRIR